MHSINTKVGDGRSPANDTSPATAITLPKAAIVQNLTSPLLHIPSREHPDRTASEPLPTHRTETLLTDPRPAVLLLCQGGLHSARLDTP